MVCNRGISWRYSLANCCIDIICDLFCGCSLAETSTGPGGFMCLLFYVGSTRRLNRQCFWFKESQKTEARLKVSSDRRGEPGIELGTPGYKASDLSTTPRRLTVFIIFVIDTCFVIGTSVTASYRDTELFNFLRILFSSYFENTLCHREEKYSH